MNPVDTVPLMLLALHLLALGVGMIIFVGMIVLHRRARQPQPATSHPRGGAPSFGPDAAPCPLLWLAVRSSDPEAVQAALGVICPAPCSWTEGITGQHELFIGPPVNEWVLVTGSGLPHPGHDVDDCFHFLVRLSRTLGRIQFFLADPVLRHHAWARVENGLVTRAYAWVNEPVWNQGAKSLAEIELNMQCFGYGEGAATDGGATGENAATNVAKVPALAARWSFDPTTIEGLGPVPANGITGKSPQFRQD